MLSHLKNGYVLGGGATGAAMGDFGVKTSKN